MRGQGHIVGPKKTKKGNSWRLKYDVGTALGTAVRQTRYQTIRCQTRTEAKQELRRILSQIDLAQDNRPKGVFSCAAAGT